MQHSASNTSPLGMTYYGIVVAAHTCLSAHVIRMFAQMVCDMCTMIFINLYTLCNRGDMKGCL